MSPRTRSALALGATTALADYVRDNRPDRVYAPGEFVAYSNYGYSLAGLMVEEFPAEFAGIGRNPDLSTAAEDFPLERYAGTYTATRGSRSGPAAVVAAMAQMTVSVTGDARLRVSGPVLGGQVWTPVEPGVFRSEEGDRLAFAERDGEVTGLALETVASQNYERVPWCGSPSLHLLAAGASLLIMVTALAWPVTALVRRLRDRSAPAAARSAVPRGGPARGVRSSRHRAGDRSGPPPSAGPP
ncbi:hypothetical protein HDA32_005012 [Spinactinospora alkalitolerans]|uniref:Beta-lactamase-related domain-containing protein n=1 Tax=Spinactinospora alkalitolerans TaxID=687207 RepID=A0A852U361_9ACTN|nr:hypothetical protein [Spinactinospora alkalitolerans]NYE49892.1 hypothetical protein [Spinactinospora alkalitolerans]